MRKAGAAFLLVVAAACGNNENVFYGSIGPSTITPFIAFDNANSVISGRATLTDADGGTTGSAELVIISDRPRLCDRLVQYPDYFRNPPEAYVALILFLPPDNRVGTFLAGRPGDEGTGSEIIGADPTKKQASIDLTGRPVAPFQLQPLLRGTSAVEFDHRLSLLRPVQGDGVHDAERHAAALTPSHSRPTQGAPSGERRWRSPSRRISLTAA